ncbi:MAG: aminotransferase [Elusimicrobia bacterium RIFOXYB2_FULL_49_7]|nr:MAG: aminotransferase [Elusimicrobia bacterium RIFOXYB2_FULL_49_7]
MQKYKEYVNTAFVNAVEPIVVECAQGATVYDESGKAYLDCFSGISVVNAGHGNPGVIEAAKAQMEKLIHCGSYVYHVKAVADLAERLAAITPGRLRKSFFANSGAEAVEGAMRLAKQYTGKQEAVALTASFHGRTNGTLSVTGMAGRKKKGGPYLPGIAFAPHPYCYRCPFKQTSPEKCGLLCADYLEEVIRYQTSDNVAFFIAEPVMGEGGIIVPPAGYFKRVKEILDAHGILFIADEVQSGFCRTGKMFAIEHGGVEPDLMAMAKGIADGFPLSAFIAPKEIADAFKPGDHLSTFGGNPVSCAAALANIQYLLKANLAAESARKGQWLMESLRGLCPSNAVFGEVRGQGLMIGIEVVKSLSSKEPAPDRAGALRASLLEKGILIGLGGTFNNVLRIQPPLVISDEELNRFVEILEQITI